MSDPKTIFEMIKKHDVKYVDYRFTDPRGAASGSTWPCMSAPWTKMP